LRPAISTFYAVESSIAMIDPRAMRQVSGLAMMLNGNVGLAEAFGQGDPILILGKENPELMLKSLICFACYTSKPLAEIAERISNQKDRK
jgi:hypothetical protein